MKVTALLEMCVTFTVTPPTMKPPKRKKRTSHVPYPAAGGGVRSRGRVGKGSISRATYFWQGPPDPLVTVSGSPGAVDGTHVCLILIQGEVSQPGRPPLLPRAQETPGPFSCGRRCRRRLVTLLSLGPGDPGQSASLSPLCRVLGSPLASFPGCHCAQQRGAMWSGPRPRHCSGGPAPPRPPLP